MRQSANNQSATSSNAENAPHQDKPLLVLHGAIQTPPMSSLTRIEAGFHLRRIQQGEMLSMPLSRPMPTIGPNCHELRLSDSERNVEWRIVYCIDDMAIVILEIFEKRTRTTPERVMQTCRDRLGRYLAAKEQQI